MLKALETMDRAELFFRAQVLVLGLFAYWAYRRHTLEQASRFRTREHERPSGVGLDGRGRVPGGIKQNAAEKVHSLADARFKKKQTLLLEGISLEGTPYQILGVRENATKEEIQSAYLARMKQYHPDKMASPATEDWEIAQRIAAKINEARTLLLKQRGE